MKIECKSNKKSRMLAQSGPERLAGTLSIPLCDLLVIIGVIVPTYCLSSFPVMLLLLLLLLFLLILPRTTHDDDFHEFDATASDTLTDRITVTVQFALKEPP